MGIHNILLIHSLFNPLVHPLFIPYSPLIHPLVHPLFIAYLSLIHPLFIPYSSLIHPLFIPYLSLIYLAQEVDELVARDLSIAVRVNGLHQRHHVVDCHAWEMGEGEWVGWMGRWGWAGDGWAFGGTNANFFTVYIPPTSPKSPRLARPSSSSSRLSIPLWSESQSERRGHGCGQRLIRKITEYFNGYRLSKYG